MKEIIVSRLEENQRIDKYLMKYLNKAPKSFVYKMIRKKNIKLNDKKITGSEIIKIDDKINIYLSDETILSFTGVKIVENVKISFKVVYEDENILICNKPVGILSQRDDKNNINTLNDQILYYLHMKGEYNIEQGSTFKPSICNRLDRNTSGIVVVGKNLPYTQAINQAFKSHNLDKYYLTAVHGKIDKIGTIKGYHIKDTNGNSVKILDKYVPGSKEVITEFKPLRYKDRYTLLEIKLITGKTHQIRASFNKFGNSILGDNKYGYDEYSKEIYRKFMLKSQFLHCYKLVFKDKDSILKEYYDREFVAEVDPYFDKVYRFFQ